jgi:phage shock protein C
VNDRLYRSVDDRVLAGVCGGLAVRMGVDPSLVRIGYAIVALLTGIFPLLVLYVIMAAVVPEEPAGFAGTGPPAPAGPGAVPGWAPPSPAGTAAAPGDPWASPATDGGSAVAPDAATTGDPAAAPAAPAAIPQWATQPPPSRRERREQRRRDPLVAVIGGLVLVGLGVYFLVRDQVTIDWGVVWAAALMAIGAVVIVAAFVRPRR